MTRYGNKARSKRDKKAAGLALAAISSRPENEIVAMLVRSYGFSQPEAENALRDMRRKSA